MRRVQLFILIFTVSLGIIFGLLAVGVYLASSQPNQYSSSWVGQMWGGMGGGGMGGMMGNGTGTTTTSSYFWIIPASLIAIGVVSGIGLAFYLAFPEIRTIKETRVATMNERVPGVLPKVSATAPTPTKAPPPIESVADSYELVARTMTLEEKKVFDVLNAHDGKYLQKYIRNETGLSRLQTHRIVARFAERGIVTVKQVGNTNEVLIADWLRSCGTQKPSTKV